MLVQTVKLVEIKFLRFSEKGVFILQYSTF